MSGGSRAFWLPFVLVTLIWGSTWIAIKMQLTQVAPEWSVAYRFILAALVLAVVLVAQRQKVRFTLVQHGLLMLQGLLQFCLNFMMIYRAEHYVPSGLLAVCFTTMVLTNPLFSRLFYGHAVPRRSLWGGALAIGGVSLMFLPEIHALSWNDLAARGLALCFGSVLAVTLGNQIALARPLRSVTAAPMMLWAMAYGAAGAALWASHAAGPPQFSFDPQYLLALLYLAVLGSSLGFTLYFGLIRSHGVTVAAYTAVFIPVVALMWSTLFEGYRWSWLNMLGGAVALAGTIIAQRKGRSRG